MKKNILLTCLIASIFIMTGCGTSEVTYSKIDFEDLSFELSSDFIKSDQSSTDMFFYNYEGAGYGKENVCEVIVSSSNYLSTDLPKTVKDGMIDEIGEIKEININGNKWTVGISKELESSAEYYYAINHNNKLYMLDFSASHNGSNCKEAYNKLISSLNIK